MRTMKLRCHTPPLPATRRESTAAHPPPLRCAHGSGQPAPSACRSRLSSAGCAVCPSRRSHTQTAHTQPPLWAWPTERPTCAGGSIPRGGAHSATADGLLHRRARPRVVVGCGVRSSPVLRAHGAPASHGRHLAPARPPHARSIPSRLPTAISPHAAPRRLPWAPLRGSRRLLWARGAP